MIHSSVRMVGRNWGGPVPLPNIAVVCHAHLACRLKYYYTVSVGQQTQASIGQETKFTFDAATQSHLSGTNYKLFYSFVTLKECMSSK